FCEFFSPTNQTHHSGVISYHHRATPFSPTLLFRFAFYARIGRIPEARFKDAQVFLPIELALHDGLPSANLQHHCLCDAAVPICSRRENVKRTLLFDNGLIRFHGNSSLL